MKFLNRELLSVPTILSRLLPAVAVISLAVAGTAFAGAVSGDSLSSFILDGKEYTLPFDQTVLEEAGWTNSQDMDAELGGMTLTSVNWEKEGVTSGVLLSFNAFNGSGDSKKIKDCPIGSVTVTRGALDNYSFSLPNGLKPGDDLAAVTALMGEPDAIDESNNYMSAYYFDENAASKVTFFWNKDEGQNNGDYICLECYQEAATDTKEDVPAYIDEYESPGGMSSDLGDAIVSIDQVLYKLPCPVKAFEENGWTLTGSEPVMADRSAYGELTKDGITLEIKVNNFADYQTSMENCAVAEITAYNYPGLNIPVPDLALSENITFNSTLEELDAIGTLEKEDQNNSFIYVFRNLDSRVFCQVSYDKEAECITSIKIQRDTLPE